MEKNSHFYLLTDTQLKQERLRRERKEENNERLSATRRQLLHPSHQITPNQITHTPTSTNVNTLPMILISLRNLDLQQPIRILCTNMLRINSRTQTHNLSESSNMAFTDTSSGGFESFGTTVFAVDNEFARLTADVDFDFVAWDAAKIIISV